MPDTSLLADRYRVGRVLITSSRAEVRRGQDTVLVRDVAIKFFRPGADTSRVDDEIRALARLSHRGLVSVFDADPSADVPYAVLERVEGRTLHDRVSAGRMSIGDVRRLGAALADALAHVHSHGFVHCGVKAATVILGDDDAPRLADFGLAHLADGTRLTKPGQDVGATAYLAPEQVHGENITSAVDVYALGRLLLECLTGRRQGPPQVPDGLPSDLARLLMCMTSPSAARRPSAQACLDALPVVGPPTLVTPLRVSAPRVPDDLESIRGELSPRDRCAS
ncbi:serine/threonine-protein kinase [Lentzea sp. NPDC059081]|uniref:serine/threonine-protein kinase n=1 Tax=Lentzea sp. NPDC059081 TaxID=3346719 RepID=UPI00367BE254